VSKPKIVYLLKIFEKESYLRDFLSGKLFMNTILYFRTLKEIGTHQRSDMHEGINEWLQPEDVELVLNGYKFTNLVAPLTMRNSNNDNLHLFCMFAGTTKEKNINSSEAKIKIVEELKIQSKIKKLGSFCVLVNRPAVFIERIRAVASLKNFEGKLGLVDYYDSHNTSVVSKGLDAAFNKHDTFSYQNEYRVLIDSKSKMNSPMTLEIGDISDVCQIINLDDFKIEFEE
jgi:hypothetical protein